MAIAILALVLALPLRVGTPAWTASSAAAEFRDMQSRIRVSLRASLSDTIRSGRLGHKSMPSGKCETAAPVSRSLEGLGTFCSRGRDHLAGYAAVDALVALSILAAVVALSIELGASALRMSRAAAETRDAQSALRSIALLPTSSPTVGLVGNFEYVLWSSRERLGLLAICHQRIELRSKATGRRYARTAHAICSVPPAQL